MTAGRSQADWLQDIREAIGNIQRYRAAVERNPDAFPLGMLEQATMDNLTIIGEAAKHCRRALPAALQRFHGGELWDFATW